ncbi:MAG: PUA domain-containing protein [Desulfurococcaceae archaeon]
MYGIDERLVEHLRLAFGSLVWKLLEELRRPPSRYYFRVNTLKTSREEVLEGLRSRGIEARPDPYVEEAAYFPVEGPFELEKEGVEGHVIVERHAVESVLLGSNLYRPGVLRASRFDRGSRILALSPWGDELAIMVAAVSSEDLHRMSRGLVAINVASPYRVPRVSELPEVSEGLVYPQGLPSIVAAKALGASPGELVVDLTAAPGGKAGHVVQLTRGLARIIALDRSQKKAESMSLRLASMGLHRNLIVIPMDAREALRGLLPEGAIDRILLDPPCSDLGIRPRLRLDKTLNDVIALSSYQRQLLRVAAKLLRPSGTMLYSTCTLTVAENEENLQYAVSELGMESVDVGRVPYADKVYFGDVVAYRFAPLGHDMPGFFFGILRKEP